MKEFAAALDDVKRSLRHWRIPLVMAWNDIAQRYRRSLIGPFWITIQTAVWTLAIGLVYGGLFRQDMQTFLPHVAAGLVMWTLIGGLIQDGVVGFSHSAPYLLQARMPKSVFVIRIVVRNLIIFAHNSVVIICAAVWGGVPLSPNILMAIPGIALILVAGIGAGFAFATIGARFRDLVQGSQSFLQVMFFLTPVMWQESMLGGRARTLIVDWNPLAAMIAVVRGPLLSREVFPNAWFLASLTAGVSMVLGFLIFARFRRRIAYWL